MKRIQCFAGVIVVAYSLLNVYGAAIPGLFNTGLNNEGALLGAEELDPHWKLLESADPEFTGPDLFTLTPGFPVGPWIAEGPNSRWIAPRPQQGTGNAEGNYTYRITFNLTGFDPTTASISGQWSTDNNGSDILINGTATGQGNTAQFGGWTQFRVTSGFVAGENTLDFVVNNASPTPNPTGFRAELTGTVLPPNTPPTVSVNPTSQIVAAGDTVLFTVQAEGTAPLTYQWRFKGNTIDGETSSTLTLSNVDTGDVGSYDVVVTNAAGTATSQPAALTVRNRVPGLFDTGVDASRTVLADGAVDPHFKLSTNPDGPSADAIVHDSTVFPIVSGPWLQNNERSKWISPRLDTVGAAGGVYVYRTTFDLTGFNPATAVLLGNWAADNDLGASEIVLNGLRTGLKTAPFTGLTPFVIQNTPTVQFFPGVNTLDFHVENQGAGYTGLRVEDLRVAADPGAPPEPDTRLSIEMVSGVSIGGFVGKSYRIEYSDQPIGDNFSTLTTLVLPSDPFLFLDEGSVTKPNRRYRVIAVE